MAAQRAEAQSNKPFYAAVNNNNGAPIPIYREYCDQNGQCEHNILDRFAENSVL